jgi:hypothetical protein
VKGEVTMKKSLLLVELNQSGEPKEGNSRELLGFLAMHDMDKIVLAGTPSRTLSMMMEEFNQDEQLVQVIAHTDDLVTIPQRDEYEVKVFDEDCCGY